MKLTDYMGDNSTLAPVNNQTALFFLKIIKKH